MNKEIHSSWLDVIGSEFDQAYMAELESFLNDEKAAGKVIYPNDDLVFNALNTTHFEQVKVVILGQDPYHGPGQAHGLCFSVLPGVRIPPSLRNIYKEINRSLSLPIPDHGNLQAWAERGVLLLNATLTVEQALAGSHQRRGWEQFTDSIIRVLNDTREGIIFMLWGSYAQKKASFVDGNKHLVLKSVHPSPLSAHRGFIGCDHFLEANKYLVSKDKQPINWSL